MLHWSFFLTLLGTVAQRSSAINIGTMCRGHSNGALLPNPQDCNSYYICQSGPQLAYCDYGLHFDRVNKVCNWPDWANCKLEEVDYDNLVAEPDHMDLSAEHPEEGLKESFSSEISEDKPTEELKESIKPASMEEKVEDQKPASPIVTEVVEETSHIQLFNEPNLEDAESDKAESNGVGSLIVSSLSKDPSSKDTIHVEDADIPPVVAPEQTSNVTNNAIHFIQVPVVVPAQNADFGTRPSNSTNGIQVPVEVPAENSPKPDASEPTKQNSMLVVQVPVVIPTEIPSSPLGGPVAGIANQEEVLSEHQAQNIDTSDQVIEEIPEAGEKVETSIPSKEQAQVIELSVPVLPVHVLTPNIDSTTSGAVKVETLIPSKEQAQVIELPAPVLPVQVLTPNVDSAISGAVKVETSIPSKEQAQVIELPAPVLPVQVLTPNIDPAISGAVKVETSIPSKEQAQVIELPAPVLPVQVLTPNVDSAISAAEKVEILKPSGATNQVIELQVPASPTEVLNSVPNAIPQAQAVVEKLESEKLPQNTNPSQVIELPVPAHPVVLPNTKLDNSSPAQAEAVVEKVEKPSDSKPLKNPTQIIELPVYAGPDVVFPIARPEVEKALSAVKEQLELSLSLESFQLSQEDSDSEATESSEEDTVNETVEQTIDSDSSEEDNLHEVEKVVVSSGPQSSEKNLASESSEEDSVLPIDPDEHKDSPESSEENVLKPGEEHKLSSDSLESSEEYVLIPSEHVHPNQTNVHKVEASIASEEHKGSPESSEENVLKPTHHQSNLNKFDSQEHKDSTESSEENVLKPNHLHYPGQFTVEKIEASHEEDILKPHHHHHVHQSNIEGYGDSQSSKEVEASSEERPSHLNHHHHHQGSMDSQSSEEDEVSSEEGLFHPHHHHHHNSAEEIDKPTNTETVEEPSAAADNDIIHNLPTPHANKPVDSPAPIGKPIAPHPGVDTRKHHSNLSVSVLSVASFQGNGSANGTINRPIVGAHNIETGHPIDVMTGYNSKNVQCIHNGLYFLPHWISCQKYFICAYHHLHMHSCGNNLIWNYKREQCELRSDSRCYSKETLAENSPKPEEPSQPSRENSTEELAPVPEITAEQTPMPPLRTTQATEVSVSRDSMLPKCPAIRQVYLPSLDDCNKYYICILGQAVLTSCPGNMHWDVRGEFCGNPPEVLCAGR